MALHVSNPLVLPDTRCKSTHSLFHSTSIICGNDRILQAFIVSSDLPFSTKASMRLSTEAEEFNVMEC